ncbi:uncharacterized protein OCT59_024518 [Rhizophagus irregularis]|uniref:Uncharacterized protein n=1 Tax=Rhizophagus irregularis (strain DAOM 181602 / DAOM 197198 / MUCL 43194) TaxID=747089 RepID=U9UBD2_RHIID|nr:hypothetical protein OCT59_024518 [Rhizophagus irregularis]GBC14329.1 hypothetical protein RIR_jg39113.t1 [Rhizophagus irregularis DAOM 181602=DAOM 197198]
MGEDKGRGKEKQEGKGDKDEGKTKNLDDGSESLIKKKISCSCLYYKNKIKILGFLKDFCLGIFKNPPIHRILKDLYDLSKDF